MCIPFGPDFGRFSRPLAVQVRRCHLKLQEPAYIHDNAAAATAPATGNVRRVGRISTIEMNTFEHVDLGA
jgi:hypothetical protein